MTFTNFQIRIKLRVLTSHQRLNRVLTYGIWKSTTFKRWTLVSQNLIREAKLLHEDIHTRQFDSISGITNDMEIKHELGVLKLQWKYMSGLTKLGVKNCSICTSSNVKKTREQGWCWAVNNKITFKPVFSRFITAFYSFLREDSRQ